jgi:hypothetical protein
MLAIRATLNLILNRLNLLFLLLGDIHAPTLGSKADSNSSSGPSPKSDPNGCSSTLPPTLTQSRSPRRARRGGRCSGSLLRYVHCRSVDLSVVCGDSAAAPRGKLGGTGSLASCGVWGDKRARGGDGTVVRPRGGAQCGKRMCL